MKISLFIIFTVLLTIIGYGQESLYYLCKNEIRLDPIAQKIISIEGGDTLVLDGILSIIPRSDKVILKVQGKGGIREIIYNVIKSPSPIIEIWSHNKAVTNSSKLPSAASDYKVKAIPDIDFASQYPNECRYRVSDYKIEVLRNGKAVDIKDRKPNDILRLTVSKIERYNFRNEKEIISMEKVFTFTLN